MVIVDTSVWINAWRAGDARLDAWMAGDMILQHPFVTAEISMGSFRSAMERARTIALLESFGQLPVVESHAFHAFVAEHELFGSGIGFADAHLLQACTSATGSKLATRDGRLGHQAKRIGIELA